MSRNLAMRIQHIKGMNVLHKNLNPKFRRQNNKKVCKN